MVKLRDERDGATTTQETDPTGGIRVPDESALPVATFAEPDFQKPDPELPSRRWQRRARRTLIPALLAAVLSSVGLGLLARTPGFEGVGLLTMLCAPIIIGTIVSLFPSDAEERTARQRRRGSIGAGSGAAFLVCLGALPLVGEGALCVLFALPVLMAAAAAAAVVANAVVDARLDRLDARFRAGLMGLITLVVPLGCAALDQLLFFDKDARSTVSSAVAVAAGRSDVWASLEHLDVTFTPPSPWTLEALLPVPVAIRGEGATAGAVREVVFDNGAVVARVTALVPERSYAIDLEVKPAGREFFDHWIDLRHSRFDLLDDVGGGTILVHTTTYRPLLFPRVAFEPLEQALGGLIQARLVEVYAQQVLGAGRLRPPPHLALVERP